MANKYWTHLGKALDDMTLGELLIERAFWTEESLFYSRVRKEFARGENESNRSDALLAHVKAEIYRRNHG